MTCNITENLCAKFFYEIKVPRVWGPEKIMIIFDHQIPANSLDNAMNGHIIHKFVRYQ